MITAHMDDPSSISSSDAEGFKTIERITRQLYPGTIVVPYVVMASTDARKYEPVCKNIYRFTPYKIDFSEMDKLHGTNENITFENVNRCVEFFYALLKQ